MPEKKKLQGKREPEMCLVVSLSLILNNKPHLNKIKNFIGWSKDLSKINKAGY